MPPPPTWVCFGSSPVRYKVVDGQKPSPSGEGGPAKPGRMRGTAWKLPPAPENQRFNPSSVKKQRFLPASPEGEAFSQSKHLALPLGELSPKVTERGVAIRKSPLRPVCALGTSPYGRGKAARRRCQLRVCNLGSRPPPPGVNRFDTGWWTDKNLPPRGKVARRRRDG